MKRNRQRQCGTVAGRGYRLLFRNRLVLPELIQEVMAWNPVADKDAQITLLQGQLQTIQEQVRVLRASAQPGEKQSAPMRSF